MYLTLANILCFLRIFLTPIIVWLLFLGPQYSTSAIVLFTIAAITDFCDGYCARRYQSVSNFGAFLDPIADKVLILGCFGAFYGIAFIPLWFLVILVVRDIVTTAIRLVMKSKGVYLVTSMIAKWKTFFQFIFIYMLFWQHLAGNSTNGIVGFSSTAITSSLYILTFLSLYSAAEYMIKNYSKLRSAL